MRRRCRRGTIMIAVGAALMAGAARADDAATLQAQLQEGARLLQSCLEPKPGWTDAQLSGNFDMCDDAVQAFVRAMELSKDPKVAGTATHALTLLNANLGETGLRIGGRYAAKDERKSALAFLHVACTSFDSVSAFDRPTPDEAAQIQAGAAEADRLLEGYRTNCKDMIAPDK